jgi:hypothetical protein
MAEICREKSKTQGAAAGKTIAASGVDAAERPF